MKSRLKHRATWYTRKSILTAVLLVSIFILGSGMRHYAAEKNWVEFSLTGSAILSMAAVFFLLLKEISKPHILAGRLQIQKEHLQVVLSSLAEGLITTNKHGEILYMNPAAEQLTGWYLDEARFQPLQTVYQVFNEESGKPFEHIVNRILKSGQKVELENSTVLLTKQNAKLIISNSGSPMHDGNGDITGVVLVFNDITEKKEKELLIKKKRREIPQPHRRSG